MSVFGISILLLISTLGNLNAEKWPCNKDDAIEAFKQKIPINRWPSFNGVDPYNNQTTESEKHIHETLKNEEIVCAIKYKDEQKISYELQQFPSKNVAIKAGFIVTHQGVCGACSNLQDLAVYLETDMTAKQGDCTRLVRHSKIKALECMRKIGLTDQCTDIALFNSINTVKHCGAICRKAMGLGRNQNCAAQGCGQRAEAKNQKAETKDQKAETKDQREETKDQKPEYANICIQCDEEKSGPIFKYFAGRNRRNSGIESEIKRLAEELYNITHCYY